jgi:hypothetical protein
VDESLAKDLDIQVKSNADGSFDSVRVKNLADYDLRPLAMEYEITCVGTNISLGGALYLDQASAMRGEQTIRMLPGAVWEVSSQDIVTALKLKASDSNDPNVYDMSSCRDAKIKLQVWETNYLTGLKLGDVVDLVDGETMPINVSHAN